MLKALYQGKDCFVLFPTGRVFVTNFYRFSLTINVVGLVLLKLGRDIVESPLEPRVPDG